MHLWFTSMNVFLQLLLITQQNIPQVLNLTPKETFTIGVIYDSKISFRVNLENGGENNTKEKVLLEYPDSVFNKRFSLEVKNVKLSNKISPMEILNIYCQTVIPMNFNAMAIPVALHNSRNSLAINCFIYFAGSLGIPVLAWGNDIYITEKELSKYIVKRSLGYYIRLISAKLSILQRFSWNDFSIVASNYAFIETVRSEVLKSESKFNSRVKIQSVIQLNMEDDEKVIRDNLAKLLTTDTRVILLYANYVEFERIFKAAREIGLTGESYIWIAVKMGDEHYDGIRDHHEIPNGTLAVRFNAEGDFGYPETLKITLELLNGGLAPLVSSPNNFNINLLSNMTCNTSEIITRDYGELFLRYWANLNLEKRKNQHTNSTNDLKIINFKPFDKWQQCGTWTPRKLKIEEEIKWPGNSRTPPSGLPPIQHIKVTFMEDPPFIFLNSPNEITGKCIRGGVICHVGLEMIHPNISDFKNFDILNNDTCCSGYSIDLLNELAKDLNFTYDLIRVKDGVWGAEVNGQWNGMVATLINHEADIAMTSFNINSKRKAVIRFSIPFLETRIAILVKKTGTISSLAFLEPFDTISWIMILVVSIHVVASAIFLLEWCTPSGNNMRMETRKDNLSLLKSYWLVWANLFGAAVRVKSPKSTSARFMSGIWALSALVFVGMYTANLTSFMTTTKVYIKLAGLKDDKLVNPNAYKTPLRYGTVPFGHTETILKNYHINLYHYRKQFNIRTIEEGMIAVKNRKLDAFIYDETVLKYVVGQGENCLNFKVEGGNALTEYGIGFPNNYKYIEIFNNQLKIYKENGYFDSLQKSWITTSCQTDKKRRGSSEPLSLYQFMGAFILLGIGIILAIIILIFERMYSRFYIKGSTIGNAGIKCQLVDLFQRRQQLPEIQSKAQLGKYYRKKQRTQYPLCKNVPPELHRVGEINPKLGIIRYAWTVEGGQ